MANSSSGESVAERIARILETFDAERSVQTPSEIARRAGLPSSTAHRLVTELVGTGLLDRDADGRVRLGMHLWEVAQRGSRALRLREAALPFMELVHARVREHIQLAVLEQGEALFLERLSDARAVSNITRIAGRLPLHASSSGLVLLAFADDELRERVLARPLPAVTADTVTDPGRLRELLARIRQEGIVVARGFVEPVSTGVAVPIRQRGRVIAALSVVLPRESPTAGAVEELRRAAAGISRRLDEPAE
ncbi:IclR family transcriptional regulator [Microbacterium marinilacus]|uniref:IclR family transcriptional regulator n=1 Tax=Microbacterium marinilacus TaxID=415209 RepID=A0ABP7BB78_9MICO|nr:IclR family transcriptional regulator [Microbacterium marinilacus]MBY0687074.1 IclR family transcriptional regulator [Microbacterium marinilacus]